MEAESLIRLAAVDDLEGGSAPCCHTDHEHAAAEDLEGGPPPCRDIDLEHAVQAENMVPAQDVSKMLQGGQNIDFLINNSGCTTVHAAADRKFQYLKMAARIVRTRVRCLEAASLKTGDSVLPEELIIHEILSRLPVKSLMRFKSVCKSWHTIISGGDPQLITLHLQRSRQQLRVLIMPGHHHVSGIVSCHFVHGSCQSEFLLDMHDLEAAASTCAASHCDGLILFSSATMLQVWNPATRESVTLPTSCNVNNPSRIQALYRPYNAAVLGHDPLTNKYKVVRFFYRTTDLKARTCSLGVEVLTLGSHSLNWVPVDQDPPYPIWQVRCASTSDGVVYWLVDNTLHTSSPQAIMSFDLKNGKFGIIPPPPSWSKENFNKFQREATLHELDGELCCTHTSGLLWNIYIYRSGGWHVNCSVIEGHMVLDSLPLTISKEGKLLISVGSSFQYFDPRTQSYEIIDGSSDRWPTLVEGGDLPLWSIDISYTESMIPIMAR